MRNCFVPSVTRIESVAQFYSTEWYVPNCANPSALQFIPLQTELQGFSFTLHPPESLLPGRPKWHIFGRSLKSPAGRR